MVDIDRIKELRTEVMALLSAHPEGLVIEALFTRSKKANSFEELQGVVWHLVKAGDVSMDFNRVRMIGNCAAKPKHSNRVELMENVYALMDSGPMSAKVMQGKLGLSGAIISTNIAALKKDGRIREVGRDGVAKVWAHADWSADQTECADPVTAAHNMVASAMKKPALGLMPESIFNEKCNANRVGMIFDAMDRYAKDGQPVPAEWVGELRRRCAQVSSA